MPAGHRNSRERYCGESYSTGVEDQGLPPAASQRPLHFRAEMPLRAGPASQNQGHPCAWLARSSSPNWPTKAAIQLAPSYAYSLFPPPQSHERAAHVLLNLTGQNATENSRLQSPRKITAAPPTVDHKDHARPASRRRGSRRDHAPRVSRATFDRKQGREAIQSPRRGIHHAAMW